MLSVATAGLIVPHERLREPPEKSTPHPSNDRDRYRAAAEQYKLLCGQRFLSSRLCQKANHGWFFDELSSTDGPPDNWQEILTPKQLGKDRTTGKMLRHLRNSLAHGNIYTKNAPSKDGMTINKVIFLSETYGGSGRFNYLMVTPSIFSKFLINWFSFVETLSLPSEPVPDGVEKEREQSDGTYDG